MARKKKHDDEESEHSGNGEMVRRELTEKQLHDKRIELANISLEILGLEEERRERNQTINVDLKELKGRVRKIASELREGAEWIPAQMELVEARTSRRNSHRPVQDIGEAVEP